MKNCMLPIDFCIPDAEAHVMSDGKVYLYGSLDCAADRWCSDSYRVVSSSNLKEWKVSKPCFSVKDVPWAGKTDMRRQLHLDEVKSIDDLPENIRMFLPKAARLVPIKLLVNQIAKQLNADAQQNLALFAPDCICKNGKYYLYFCMSDNTEGVAVADQPEGPFINAAQLPVTGIDPAVFVDDDGTAYYYWGQFNSHGARLTPDMMHIEEGSIVDNLLTEQEHHFHEGSSMRKRNGIYYYVFADISRGKPTCLGYATSKSPLGPFTYQGIIVDNSNLNPESWNNHGSIEEINGQWYVFFHVSTTGKYKRKACMLPIEFDENGLIREVKFTEN